MRNRIAILRESKKMSQAELAKAVGISRPYLSDIERGISDPTTKIARRICEVLGRPFEDVFCADESAREASADV